MKRTLFGIAGTAVLLFLFSLVDVTVAYRDWSFICENTGSRKGYREWRFGLQTRQWYQASAVETFMQQKFPAELTHRWTSYAGTGRNVFGGKLLHGHGRPGPVLQLKPETIEQWFTPLPDEEKKAFYDLLAKGDRDATTEKVNSINDDLFAAADAAK